LGVMTIIVEEPPEIDAVIIITVIGEGSTPLERVRESPYVKVKDYSHAATLDRIGERNNGE
jgi:hypothetical protein